MNEQLSIDDLKSMLKSDPEKAFSKYGKVVFIELCSEQDNLGRQVFFANWISGSVGPSLHEIGIKSQVFNTRAEEFEKRQTLNGNKIIYDNEQNSCGQGKSWK